MYFLLVLGIGLPVLGLKLLFGMPRGPASVQNGILFIIFGLISLVVSIFLLLK